MTAFVSSSATSLPATVRAQALIDGHFADAEGQSTFATFDPATGRVIAKVAACSAADVDRAVRAARKAFNGETWSRDPQFRKTTLLRFAALVEAHAAELAQLESVNAGKPITDCQNLDLPDVVNNLRWYAQAIDKVFGKISPTGSNNLGLIIRQPVGVVGAVLPWNFPLGTLSWKIAPALAAGNALVVKPAEQAPLSTLRIAELALEAGVPAGIFNVVPGMGPVAGQALGLHADVDMITFTGSTEIGRQFLRYAADSNLKNIVLECGGKSPQVIMSDVAQDLDMIAENLAGAAFWNMGQNCTCGSRILVHRSLKDDFVRKLVAASRAWIVGSPADPATKVGPLIEPAALEGVVGAIDQARNDGARIVTGGRQVLKESGGCFVEPTIIDDVTPAMAIARREVFGPVVAIIPFDSEEEAVAIANDTEYGLAATVFTNDLNVAVRVSRKIQAGTVAINGYGEGDITTPFGGYKTSGFGGYDKGLEAFDQYTDLKTIWMNIKAKI